MRSFFRLLLALVPFVALAAPARAEGLVQLTLHGVLAQQGGGPVEIDWHFYDGEEVKEVGMRLHLAEYTKASDIASLLAKRLRQAGAEVTFPGEHERSIEVVNLFVEDTVQVNLRLHVGLHGTVTVCESAPESVRFLKPLEAVDSATIRVTTSTYQPHSKMPGTIHVGVEADGKRTPASICEDLFNQGLEKGLVGDRPTADTWRPTKTSDGASITGCSIELRSAASDWGLQVKLARPL